MKLYGAMSRMPMQSTSIAHLRYSGTIGGGGGSVLPTMTLIS
eukprot:CAMPEP_0205937066 /NCGR_PEP_ID=MMETSP1325-20131115/43161_1 /ASSEMBLY_ACC=CAM_ASM_000708 /TAXON_ID=236786 /ORGANISM="Florenciella sp., Strain RCC1007" /LENGTH=41 /DNA_ID= /DNA_START= /DNA_END= /DNA_ORIENTATION=